MNEQIVLPWKHAEWSIVDGLFLPALVGVMRLCWIWPWMILLQGFLAPSVVAPLMPPLMVVALPILSFTFARWNMPTLSERRDPGRVNSLRRQIATAGFVALLFLLWFHSFSQDFALWDMGWLLAAGYDLIYWDSGTIEVPGTLLFLLLGIFLWLRGALDGQSQYRHDEVWRAFIWGGAALTFFAWIVPTDIPGSQPAATFNPFGVIEGRLTNPYGLLLLFCAAGLSSLGVANLGKSGGWRRTARLGRMRPNRGWLVGISLTICALLGLALLIGLLIQPEDAAILWRALGLLWRGISAVLIWIITVIAYPIFLVVEYLVRLLRSLFGERTQEVEPQPNAPPPTAEPFPEPPERAVQAVPEPYRWVALLAIAAGVFIIFMLALRQLRRRPQKETDELRESVLTANLLQAQLSDLWARLRSRFAPAAIEPDPFLSLDGEMDTRRLIRFIYQRLLAVAPSRTSARLRSETPMRFGNRLSRHPDFDPALVQTITAGYTAARYGDAPPSSQAAEAVRKAWQEIETGLSTDDGEEEPKQS